MRDRFNCPNCGAPITSTKCPYCGSVLFDFIQLDNKKQTYTQIVQCRYCEYWDTLLGFCMRYGYYMYEGDYCISAERRARTNETDYRKE